MASTDVFQASDLAKSRRDFIGAGRSGRALLRDTDGFGLIMVPLSDWECTKAVSARAFDVLRTETALRRSDVRPAELPFGWLLEFDVDDRQEFLNEVRDALSVAETTHDLEPVETCIRDWIRTAKALSDPLRRAILTAPGDDDYEEVGRPG
jgi:Family of unknown function (DUF6247)